MKTKLLILSLAVLALLMFSCGKEEGGATGDGMEVTPFTEPDHWEWETEPDSGFTLDTAWDGDTIIVEFLKETN